MPQIYTEDTVHHDANQELAQGLDEMISLAKMFRSYFPNFQARMGDSFIGKTDEVPS